MKWLYPIVTGRTLIDVPFTYHFAFWYFIGSCFYYSNINYWKAVFICFPVAIGWEIFERFAEKEWSHIWKHPESWQNSYISDLATVFLGIALAYWLGEKQ